MIKWSVSKISRQKLFRKYAEAILDHAEEQFSSIKRKQIDVPEWNTTIYSKPLTLSEKRKLYRNLGAKSEDVSSMMVEALIMKAEDKDGKKVFTPDDRDRLMNKVDPDVVSAVATEILYFKDAYSVEKKII